MAVMEFRGYNVLKTEYYRNENFNNDKTDQIELDPKIKASMEISDANSELTLSISIGSLDSDKFPFEVNVELKGYFVYKLEEDEDSYGFKNLLEANGVAILYPYVRSLVSTLTNSSNEYPGYNMPTINVHEALKASKEDFSSE